MNEGYLPQILEFLKDHADMEFESYHISRAIGCHQSTANDLLRELNASKKIKFRKDGYCLYWSYDRSSDIKQKMLCSLWVGDFLL